VTFSFNLLRAMVVTYRYAEDQGQGQSVRKIDWKQTDGRTDGRRRLL